MSREKLYDLFIEETGDIETGEVDNNYFKIWLEEYVQTHDENYGRCETCRNYGKSLECDPFDNDEDDDSCHYEFDFEHYVL